MSDGGGISTTIKQKLFAEFKPEFMTLEDTSDGCGSKFKLILVSTAFDGKGLLDRQRSVNKCLEDEMKIVHALQMKTWTSTQAASKIENYAAAMQEYQMNAESLFSCADGHDHGHEHEHAHDHVEHEGGCEGHDHGHAAADTAKEVHVCDGHDHGHGHAHAHAHDHS
jgi:stress-induced morphogen